MTTDRTSSIQKWNPAIETGREDEIHLLDYVDSILKRRWMVLFVFLIVSSGAAGVTVVHDPVFEAATTLIIEQETASPITGERMEYAGYDSQILTFNTHFKLITSKPVIKRVIQELHLDTRIRTEKKTPNAVKACLLAQTRSLLKLLGLERKPALTENRDLALYNEVAGKVTVEEVKDTQLLKILVKDEDPEMASALANSFARQYMEFTLSNRAESSRKNLEWITTELYSLKQRLEHDEKQFLAFKEENQMVSLQGKQKVFEQKITEYNNRYLETRNKRMEIDAVIAELQRCQTHKKNTSGARSLINTPLIATTYSKVQSLEIDYAKLTRMYKSKHPKVIQLLQELNDSREKLAEEIGNEVASLKSQRNVLQARESILKKSIEEFEREALETGSRELDYLTLNRTVTTNQKLYDTLLERLKESDILKNSDSLNISVIENAEAPSFPVSLGLKRTLFMGMTAGLFLGCLLAFVLEYLDQTVRNEEDIERYLNIKVLSVIPESEQPGLLELTDPDRESHIFGLHRSHDRGKGHAFQPKPPADTPAA